MYKAEAAKYDSVGIINKLNEHGANCPTFVVANLNHIPITTADSFDLSNSSEKIEMVESRRTVSPIVLTHCPVYSQISVLFLKIVQKNNLLIDEMAGLKICIATKKPLIFRLNLVALQMASKQTTRTPLEHKSVILNKNQSLLTN